MILSSDPQNLSLLSSVNCCTIWALKTVLWEFRKSLILGFIWNCYKVFIGQRQGERFGKNGSELENKKM